MKALISVSDKTGIVEFAKELEELGIEIISTGGTYKKLKEEGVKAIEISDEEINKWIQQGIEYFRENPEEYSYFMGFGNSMVHMYKFDEDKEYYVIVSKDYESGEIEFEKEDYRTN